MHKDTDHADVVGVHPETGRAKKDRLDKKRLASWAHDYDRGRGQIVCPERAERVEWERARRELKQYETAAPAPPWPTVEARLSAARSGLTDKSVLRASVNRPAAGWPSTHAASPRLRAIIPCGRLGRTSRH